MAGKGGDDERIIVSACPCYTRDHGPSPAVFKVTLLPAVELETKVHEVFTITEKAPTKVFLFSLLSHLRIYYKDTTLHGRYPMVLEDVKLSI